jgi:hypothetical protein
MTYEQDKSSVNVPRTDTTFGVNHTLPGHVAAVIGRALLARIG